MISRKNFVDVDPTQIPVDTEYFQCNFMRTQPDESGAQPVGHRLFPGDDTPRIFRECNLVNCEPPPNSTGVIQECFADTVLLRQIPSQ
jgi:hypothetical protein